MKSSYERSRSIAVFDTAQIAFNLMVKHHYQSVVVGVEDSCNPKSVGYGKIIVSHDYFDSIFENVPNEQKIWVNCGMDFNQLKINIYELIKISRFLPQRLTIDEKVINLDDLYLNIKEKKGVSQAIAEINKLINAVPIIVLPPNQLAKAR
ncbi:hypothetical protein [Thalassotalea piscium]|uniref:Uncharacterized protein n=1 Tax=Thalassotalea piscium TaxID=1230533 RepID=A0A7X0TTJ0_9GAMM|nr:hypothetical protein [Thalassotalea piscium]MBB6543135.1 hypothetical protein [Thalassotalea piscium]